MSNLTAKSYPDTTREDLPNNFDGSPKRPIRINQDFGAWNVDKLENINIYVERGVEFDLKFWEKVYENNLAIVFVDLPRKFGVKRG